MSVSARVVGIIRHPRQTLQEVASHPTWVSLLVGLTVATAAAGALVSGTEVGQLALVDQWERTVLAFGEPIDDARYAELQAWSRRGPAVAAASAVVAGPGVAVAVSLLAFGWLRHKTAPVSYSQVLAVVVHAGVILALGRMVAAPHGVRPRNHGQRHHPGLVVFGIRRGVGRWPVSLGQSTCSRSGGPSCWESASPSCRDGGPGRARRGW